MLQSKARKTLSSSFTSFLWSDNPQYSQGAAAFDLLWSHIWVSFEPNCHRFVKGSLLPFSLFSQRENACGLLQYKQQMRTISNFVSPRLVLRSHQSRESVEQQRVLWSCWCVNKFCLHREWCVFNAGDILQASWKIPYEMEIIAPQPWQASKETKNSSSRFHRISCCLVALSHGVTISHTEHLHSLDPSVIHLKLINKRKSIRAPCFQRNYPPSADPIIRFTLYKRVVSLNCRPVRIWRSFCTKTCEAQSTLFPGHISNHSFERSRCYSLQGRNQIKRRAT